MAESELEQFDRVSAEMSLTPGEKRLMEDRRRALIDDLDEAIGDLAKRFGIRELKSRVDYVYHDTHEGSVDWDKAILQAQEAQAEVNRGGRRQQFTSLVKGADKKPRSGSRGALEEAKRLLGG